MHEATKQTRLGKPNDSMDMVGHNHESNATCVVLVQLGIEHAQQDSFRMIVIQETSTSINGKRDEMSI